MICSPPCAPPICSALIDATLAHTMRVHLRTSIVDPCINYGKPVVGWLPQPEICGGYRRTTGDERVNGGGRDDAQAPHIDAIFRVPLGTAIGNLDRIELLAAYGNVVAPPQWYEIVQPPNIGRTIITLYARLINDGEQP